MLNPQQEKFCNWYVECGNASEAYRRSYSCKKKSAEWIAVEASRLKNDHKISLRIKELQERMREKSDITKAEVLKVLKSIMYADIRDFLTLKEGQLTFKDSSEWTKEMAMQVIELKLNGKAWSIQRICKMLGFDTPQELNVNMAKPMSMEEAQKIISEL